MNHIKEEVFVISDDDSDAEGMDTKGPLLLEQVKSIVNKELIVYTTRLEQMLLPFNRHDVSLEEIEKASKPMLKQKRGVAVKSDPLHIVENKTWLEELQIPLLENTMKLEFTDDSSKPAQRPTESQSIPLRDYTTIVECIERLKTKPPASKQIKDVAKKLDLLQSVENEPDTYVQKSDSGALELKTSSNLETTHPPLHRGLCKPLSVILTDYRKYPVLSAKELLCWNTFRRSHHHGSSEGKLDHVVKIVHVRSGIMEIFHMGEHGILKVEKGPTGCLTFSDLKITKTMEIIVCCWYSKNKYLRELYLQLEKSDEFSGLSRYLPHYVMLCGHHKCPPNRCSCCECCKKRVWYQKTDSSKHKLDLTQKVPEKSSRQNMLKDTKQSNIASKYLVAKALAYTSKNIKNPKRSITVQNVAKLLKETVKDVLLEIRYVNKETRLVTVNRIKILDLGPNGQIQSYVEKTGPDFNMSGLVDECKKKNTHDVCCWKSLHLTIDFLKANNYLPEVYQFLREKHNCPSCCNCCCRWKQVWNRGSLISNKPKSTDIPMKSMTKPAISVKPLKSLITNCKPVKRRIKKSMVIGPKTTQAANANSSELLNTMASAVRPPMVDENTLNVKQIYVPAGTPVNGYGVNSQLMQSIIDEEITRLIETNSMIPTTSGNGYNLVGSISDLSGNMVTPEKTINAVEVNREVPEVTEVNDYIKEIIDKFRDIRFTLNKEGRVTAIISNPPASAGDVQLLKNLLEKIQALLDMQTEKSDKTLSNILGMEISQVNTVPVYYIPAAQFDYLEVNDSTQQYLNKADKAPDSLANLLTRAPVPPNFPAVPDHINNDDSFVNLYKASEDEQMLPTDNCLGNIKIAKVESIVKKEIETVPQKKTIVESIKEIGMEPVLQQKTYESIRHRAKLQLNRLRVQSKQNRAPKTPLVSAPIPPLISVSAPTAAVVNSVPSTSSQLLNVTPSTPEETGVPTLSSTSHASDQLPPLSMFSPCVPTSGFITPVPIQCPSGITSIPRTALPSTYLIPLDIMPTVKVMQNAGNNFAQTIIIPDGDEEETILGD